MIPINEFIIVIEQVTNPQMTKLVEMCLRCMFFSFQVSLYEKTYGVSTWSPLSPDAKNNFMYHFEG